MQRLVVGRSSRVTNSIIPRPSSVLSGLILALVMCGRVNAAADNEGMQSSRGPWDTSSDAIAMMKAVGQMAGSPGAEARRPLVLAACGCARLGIPYVKEKQAGVISVIETAEKWARGEAVTAEQITRAIHAAAADRKDSSLNAALAANFAASVAFEPSDALGIASRVPELVMYAELEARRGAARDGTAPARVDVMAKCAGIIRRCYPKPSPETMEALETFIADSSNSGTGGWTRRKWNTSKDGSLMIMALAGQAGPPGSTARRRLVMATCECVRQALPFVKRRKAGILTVLDTAERWGRGESVTLDQVESAASADSGENESADTNPIEEAYGAANAAARVALEGYHADTSAEENAVNLASNAVASAANAARRLAVGSGDPSAARAEVQRKCADVVRRYYPKSPQAMQ